MNYRKIDKILEIFKFIEFLDVYDRSAIYSYVKCSCNGNGRTMYLNVIIVQ